MASIRQLRSGMWNVQIRVKGERARSATFSSEKEARSWALKQSKKTKISDLPESLYELGDMYCHVGLRDKSSGKEVSKRLRRLCSKFVEYGLPLSISKLSEQHVNFYRLNRLKEVATLGVPKI